MALICLALAWADPVKKDSKSSQTLLALVDTSASVNKEGLRAFIESLRNFSNAGENLSISLFPFAKNVDRDPIVLSGSFNSDKILREIQET